jgi:hypothetical protein
VNECERESGSTSLCVLSAGAVAQHPICRRRRRFLIAQKLFEFAVTAESVQPFHCCCAIYRSNMFLIMNSERLSANLKIEFSPSSQSKDDFFVKDTPWLLSLFITFSAVLMKFDLACLFAT